eukprot:747611-Hanusia_phi.AAC.2
MGSRTGMRPNLVMETNAESALSLPSQRATRARKKSAEQNSVGNPVLPEADASSPEVSDGSTRSKRAKTSETTVEVKAEQRVSTMSETLFGCSCSYSYLLSVFPLHPPFCGLGGRSDGLCVFSFAGGGAECMSAFLGGRGEHKWKRQGGKKWEGRRSKARREKMGKERQGDRGREAIRKGAEGNKVKWTNIENE